MKKVLVAVFLLFLFTACNKTPVIPSADLGSGQISDPSLTDPAAYRISVSQPNPTPAQAQVPVIICCHGYSASTFEWDEFRTWSGGRTDYYIDQVLLAGHGTTYANFKKSTYGDWEKTLIDEYLLLVSEGYQNISFAGSSTSCTLLLDLVDVGFFKGTANKIHLFMVDPIVIPSDKFLPLISVLGPVLGYVTANNAPGEEKYYYHYRPAETLEQLQDLLANVRGALESGITLPANVDLKVYKSIKDPTADPVSAVLIYKGVTNHDGSPIAVQLVNSNLHVFTRLSLVPNVTALDKQNQSDAFTDITTRVLQ